MKSGSLKLLESEGPAQTCNKECFTFTFAVTFTFTTCSWVQSEI